MEVYVNAKSLRFSQAFLFPNGSAVKHLLERVVQHQGVCCQDFYVVTGGRRSDSDELLQDGCVYHVEPRLRGGKGGFGSMLRALGAQIEKTTNREACRDLSGRRLRDVNHEKEMADWLKKQADREAEKEQRRAERLQRKLSEPKHMFADPQYQQQCHDLSERLEESVLKGLQASSSTQVKVSDVTTTKRPNGDQSEQPPQKKKKKAAAWDWMGVGDLPSSDEEEEEDEEEEASSSSSSSCGGVVAMTTQRREEPESSSSPSPTRPPESRTDQTPEPAQTRPSEDPRPESPCQQRPASPSSATSVEQLEALGMDALKEALMSRGLKCGGTLSERAARLFAVRGLSSDQIDPALLAKPGKSQKK
ncbi:splicing regulator SDE2 [Salarias fasciatus]|uniref:splicing regulator SDE2 n=1 Tax=Salarias fasciatus TaxID=181472 RepID=UPI0011767055|nr:replication stress response regulator SDE2 [Salarias fasciatus]